MSYYERWITSVTERLVASDLVTRAEIASGRPGAVSGKADSALSPAAAVAAQFKIPATRRNVPVAARFQVGQPVRARNIHPVTHTRLPRYARGKVGKIERDHGVFVFADTSVYSARELWGDQTPAQDCVYLDLYDDYLQPA